MIRGIRRGVDAGNQLVLNGVAVTEIGRDDHVDHFLDITMTVEQGSARRDGRLWDRGPRVVARFRLDGMVALPA